MKIKYSDVLIVGAGLAGLRTAIGIKRRGMNTTVLSLVPAKRSHSAAAQGGMQASLGNNAKGWGDNEDLHFLDTVRGSDWGADQSVVRMFTHTAPKAVRELANWGVPWNRVEKGERYAMVDGKQETLVEDEQAHGLITARNFGGTQKWRTCYVADGTGHSMLYCMSNQAIAENIPVHERMEALALVHDDGRCYGAVARNLMSGELVTYLARATCIASGGYGRLFRHTTNATICQGMGAAIALETGRASLGNMEAVQFHPTAIFPAGILVTEGCRGDGGLLLDKDLHRFMPDYEPEKKELASRDVVARWMETHIKKDKGAQSSFGEHLWLDIRLLGAQHIATRLREVKEICQYFLGIDPSRELIPVRPAQHYSMGGIRTDANGHSPGLRGLFAVGEAACWDLHGFNRLGGNSVAETVVGGMIVGEKISDFLASDDGQVHFSSTLAAQAYAKQKERLSSFDGDERPSEILANMQDLMSEKVGIFRHGADLEEAVAQLRKLYIRTKNMRVMCSSRGANPELVTAYRVQGMIKLALCVSLGALRRCESRGAHFRVDFPLRNDKEWLCRSLATWDDLSEAPNLLYEPLKISEMELPPGWRGYGSKDLIAHPDTTIREGQIEALKRDTLSKTDLQEKILPYHSLLPENLRRENARFDKEGTL